MTHILHEAAWWLFSAIVLGPAWFGWSCFILGWWAIYDATRRVL